MTINSVLLLLLIGIAVAAILFGLFGIRFIPNNRVGVVEKTFAVKGSVKAGSFIALNGEAGFQPEVLRGGLHWKMPIQFSVRYVPLVTIPQGQIGYIFARDGSPLAPTQTLGRTVSEGKSFQDVTGFLRGGGQRGPQREILREGTYAFNLALFAVFTGDGSYYLPISREDAVTFERMATLIQEREGFSPIVIKGSDDMMGIVTVHDGPSLQQGEIIALTVGDNPKEADTYHNNFQDVEKFLEAGGRRGRQLQVLAEGTYYINRLFATAELIAKTVIDVGFVGVVVSYVGYSSEDLSGEDYKHGEMVERGSKGVWNAPMMPGKYAFNTYAGKVILVPTTNVILKWNKDEVGSHRFDENLSAIELITKDAFEPMLPLSVVMHIDYRKAPLVIQRFGDIKRLVDQTLDPMVAAYFKNIGQTRTLIELIQERSKIQEQSSHEMKAKFEHYNLELEEVLIGTPGSSPNDRKIEEILAQLRDRQIAVEQIETYTRKEAAASKERELRQAEAIAQQQTSLTQSEVAITIQGNEGRAAYQRSLQEAEKIKALADADASRTRSLADAEAWKIRALADADASKIKSIADADAEREAKVGIARALATEEQVRAYGGPQYQVLQGALQRFSEAIEKSGVDIVPRVVISGGNGGANGGNGAVPNAFEGLMALLLSEKIGINVGMSDLAEPNEEVKKIRERLMRSMTDTPTDTPPELPAIAPESNFKPKS